MRWLVLLAIATLACGRVTTGQNAAADAELKSIRNSNTAQIAAHQMTHVEAVNKYNVAIERIYGQLNDANRLMASYRLALAAEVDAGRMTEEMSNYLLDQRMADLKNQAAATAAVAAADRPINCTATAAVGAINASCY